MPEAPYKRSYKHRAQRGKELRIKCDFCNRLVPRWKTFTLKRGFSITDTYLLKQFDRHALHLTTTVVRACPSCARFRGIVQPGKSVRKKGREA